jgi:hypothetical protein
MANPTMDRSKIVIHRHKAIPLELDPAMASSHTPNNHIQMQALDINRSHKLCKLRKGGIK